MNEVWLCSLEAFKITRKKKVLINRLGYNRYTFTTTHCCSFNTRNQTLVMYDLSGRGDNRLVAFKEYLLPTFSTNFSIIRDDLFVINHYGKPGFLLIYKQPHPQLGFRLLCKVISRTEHIYNLKNKAEEIQIQNE